jgi:hypothetical protein
VREDLIKLYELSMLDQEGGGGPNFHRGFSTRCLGRVGKRHNFADAVQNYKAGAA